MSFWKCPKCEHENRIIPPHFEGQWFGSLTEIKGVAKIECGECKTLFDSISISATDIQKLQAERDHALKMVKLIEKKREALQKISKQFDEDRELEERMGRLEFDVDVNTADFSELKRLGDLDADPEGD